MKRVITLLFFIFISVFSFSEDYRDINNIKTLKMLVNEKNFNNNKSTEKTYDILYKLPNMLKKTMLEPKSHKGEIFIYKDNKKIVYLPIFNQLIEENNVEEENYIVDTITFFQKKYKNDSEFKKIYNTKNKFQVKKENLNLNILKMENIEGYRLPVEIKIYDKDILIAHLKLSNITINKNISESEFKI
ncbi:hypothetical protein [Fusobacterium perfoetens]|uniref:hypothetical protein n=1 Tax=Fusobacterium perfoetens TaxID=852 RepID=UPI00047FA917|nr:hypothetical protein [Fusobacterium perfoetens]